jgi:hypothetical protein
VDGPFVEQQEMEMEREIIFLSDGELDAVVGGRMNNGQINQLVLKNPDYGVPGSNPDSTTHETMKIIGGAVVGLLAGVVIGSRI